MDQCCANQAAVVCSHEGGLQPHLLSDYCDFLVKSVEVSTGLALIVMTKTNLHSLMAHLSSGFPARLEGEIDLEFNGRNMGNTRLQTTRRSSAVGCREPTE